MGILLSQRVTGTLQVISVSRLGHKMIKNHLNLCKFYS